MELGKSKEVDMLFRYMDDDTKRKIDQYVMMAANRKGAEFNNTDEIREYFNANYYSNFTDEQLIDLRTYTGYYFRYINAVLRNNWTYEVNGKLDDKTIMECRRLSYRISDTINSQNKLGFDLIAFRGTTLHSFKKYGINEMNDLMMLKGKYLYELGFTSTSLLENTCYFNKDIGDGKKYNVEIRYKILNDSIDGIMLGNGDLSYSENQNEFLLDKNTLSSVNDVVINADDTAIITVVVIPKHVWNLVLRDDNVKKR